MTGTTRRQFVGQAAALLSGAALTGAAGAVVGCTPAQDGSATPESDGGHIGDSIDGFLTETVPEGAGLTALAARHGEIVYCKGIGFADRESNIGAECDTVYDIGSITKQFTAAAILKLEMAGELATSDPLSDFVDGLPEDKQDITLHRLLTNTSGLVEQIGDDYDAQSRDGILAAAARSDLLSAPGTEYHYSNVGYSVLAAVIEMVSGIGYEEYLSRYLFVPAGMAHTGYVLPNWERTQVAVEYDAEGTPKGRPNDHLWDTDGPYWNLRGNGGILSTAPDMFRWHVALDGHGILSEAAKKKLFEPHVLEDDGETHYGYGWVVMVQDERKVVWHNGGNGSSYAEFARLIDEGVAVFWSTNHAEQDLRWNLEELELTQGMVDRLREDG
ncbi:CubicO group peptidase (beta-lactamase class C family) [Nocardiopsis mwathae]|uniref:CubicO group peptidase (Beta-lactamase class C family) n=1 Tax=Nocardiopsis mwathae TaxID=1472723 RepID=A0A7W9YFX4_9ACTN|nr:serine hydrolase domain-containing protein [Nocardiopsis mwathae]MBB6171344.1 CubicO group peptidase (beta-lactamase class C family) [Nocardiopsis mwathae]